MHCMLLKFFRSDSNLELQLVAEPKVAECTQSLEKTATTSDGSDPAASTISGSTEGSAPSAQGADDVSAAKPTTTKPPSKRQLETPGKQSSKKQKNEDLIDGLLIQTLGQINTETKDDEDNLFGRQVSATLRRLSRHQKAIAKLQIQSVLLNVEFPGPATCTDNQAYYPYNSEV